jgi:hypothetical protein
MATTPYIPRIADSIIERSIGLAPAVAIEGIKGADKTAYTRKDGTHVVPAAMLGC